MSEKNKILIIGATGYLGKYMVNASVSLGYPTYAFVRPSSASPSSSKSELLQQFRDNGIHILQGYLDDHNSLVDAFKQVDIVISAVAAPQHLDQHKIIKAIKEAGNIKRFLPSEYANEVGRFEALPPYQRMNDGKREIRRAVKEARIPHTIVAANCLGAYFVDFLLHPREKPQPEELLMYGDGHTKAVLNLEDDVATIVIKVANDPRTLNKLVIIKPFCNTISQSELVSLWEKKTGLNLKRNVITEAEMIKQSETLPLPQNLSAAILHSIFIQGDQTNFEVGEDSEASELYPDYKFTSIDEYLDICVDNPRE
ncbi:hypothetical protein KI387_034368, partial [Taxus chinensis]